MHSIECLNDFKVKPFLSGGQGVETSARVRLRLTRFRLPSRCRRRCREPCSQRCLQRCQLDKHRRRFHRAQVIEVRGIQERWPLRSLGCHELHLQGIANRPTVCGPNLQHASKAGNSSQVRPAAAFLFLPPHCLKKKGTPAAPSSVAALSAHDHPIDPRRPQDRRQVQWTEQRLARKETHRRGQPRDNVRPIEEALSLDATAEPDLRARFAEARAPATRREVHGHAFRPLGEDLVGVPVRLTHGVEYAVNELVGHPLMK